MKTRQALVLVGLSGCARSRALNQPAVEDPPSWSTAAGKEKAQLELVRVLVDGNAPEQALTVIADLRKGGADEAELDVLQARALRKVGLFDDSEAILLSCVKKNRRYSDAWAELGALHLERHRIDEAIDAYRTAVKLDPDDAALTNDLGFALLAAGRPDEAVVALRRSLELDAAQPRTRNNLAFSLVAAGREDEAYRVFRASLSEADARYNLGLGLELRGEATAASEAYAQALTANPKHDRARARLLALAATSSDPPLPVNPLEPSSPEKP